MLYFIPALLAVASVGMSLYGAVQGSSAAKKAAAERSAALRAQANLMRSFAARDAQKIRDNMPRVLGAQVAGYAAAGVKMNTGSPMQVAYDTIREINKDVFSTVWNAEMKARAVEVGANVAVTEGNAMAKQIEWKGYGDALSTIGTTYYNYASLDAKGGGQK
jgi:hypothetical protein